jgi:hypothetical protein
MANPTKLTIEELKMGIRDTKKALRRAEELFKDASLSENISLGRSNHLESTAKHVEKLEKDLAAFEAEIEAKTSQ